VNPAILDGADAQRTLTDLYGNSPHPEVRGLILPPGSGVLTTSTSSSPRTKTRPRQRFGRGEDRLIALLIAKLKFVAMGIVALFAALRRRLFRRSSRADASAFD